jgi:toxin-antitoxin system PIN domain toxin
MWLADSNVWLALTLLGHDFHPPARTWFQAHARREKIVFCRATQTSFLRLITTPAVMTRHHAPAFNNRDAWVEYEQLLANDAVLFVPEPMGLDSLWKVHTDRPTISPKLWMDAYLTAFAVAGNFKLVTTDRGFRQFPGLDVHVIEK